MGEDENFPRIVVTDDSIFVYDSDKDLSDSDNEWEEKNVALEDSSDEDEEEKDEGEFKVDDLVLTEEGLKGVLEDIVGDIGISDKDKDGLVAGDFYGADKSGDFYESSSYDLKKMYEEGVDIDYVEPKMKNMETVEEERRGGQSILESMGFKDEEAEKKRREKREGNFI